MLASGNSIMARLEQHPLGLRATRKRGCLWGECPLLHQPYQQKVWAQPDSLLGSPKQSRDCPPPSERDLIAYESKLL